MTGLSEQDPERRPSLVNQWRALTPGQRWGVTGTIALIVAVALILGWESRSEQRKILRQQFHLPSNMAFATFDGGSSKVRWPALQGSVQFSESAHAAYLETLNDPAIWTPDFPRYRGVTTVAETTPEALQWRDDRPPLRFGSDGMADWGIFGDESIRAIRRARFFCYAILELDTPAGEDDRKTRAVSCWQLAAEDDPVLVVEGVLDLDRRTLHMRI